MHSVYLSFIMFASTFQRTHMLVPGLLIWQTWRKTSLWRKIALASPTLRGVPSQSTMVLESTTCIIRSASATQIKQSSLTLTLGFILLYQCCITTTPLSYSATAIYWRVCNNVVELSDSTLCNIIQYWLSVSRKSTSCVDLGASVTQGFSVIYPRKGPDRPWYQIQADCRKPQARSLALESVLTFLACISCIVAFSHGHHMHMI